MPHFLCSMLNETLAFDSADEKRLTGTETSPNEMVAVPMERAGIGRRTREEGSGNPRKSSGPRRL